MCSLLPVDMVLGAFGVELFGVLTVVLLLVCDDVFLTVRSVVFLLVCDGLVVECFAGLKFIDIGLMGLTDGPDSVGAGDETGADTTGDGVDVIGEEVVDRTEGE